MTVRVQVQDGEALREALRRFGEQVQLAYQRPWAKPRLGYSEKAGAVRRRRRLVESMNARRGSGLKFVWRWQSLWRRESIGHGFSGH